MYCARDGSKYPVKRQKATAAKNGNHQYPFFHCACFYLLRLMNDGGFVQTKSRLPNVTIMPAIHGIKDNCFTHDGIGISTWLRYNIKPFGLDHNIGMACYFVIGLITEWLCFVCSAKTFIFKEQQQLWK